MFASNAANGLLDGHIWLSIITRPQQSTFTRVQRVSCCLCLIFLTMVANAMFFGASDKSPKTMIRLGNAVFNVTGVMIGIQASLIVIPPSMLVIEIFRHLAPRKYINKKKNIEDNGVYDADDHDDDDDDDTSLQHQNLQLSEKSKEIKHKKPFMFPHWCKYIAFVVIALASIGSAIFTFFYSLVWGPAKSNEWLGSLFMGIFQSIFVIQPIKAIFVAILLSMIIRKPVE